MTNENAQKSVAYNFIGMLKRLKDADTSKVNDCIDLIQSICGVSCDSPIDFENYNYFPTEIESIFQSGAQTLDVKPYASALASVDGSAQFQAFVDSVEKKGIYKNLNEGTVEYMNVHAKVMAKFSQKKTGKSASKPEIKKTPKVVSAEDEKEANEKKDQGNAAIQKQNYNAAVRFYTEAIEKVPEGPSSHIYYSNRAAAYCYQSNWDMAIEDCKASLALNDKYVKAYSRLGMAYYNKGDYSNAIEAYETCIELEPNVKSHKDGKLSAKSKLAAARVEDSPSASSRGGSGVPGGMGGMPGGLDGLLKNPEMMKMAQNMMGNGGMESLMKNPEMMKMAQEMSKNPAMLQNMMGMLNGGGGGGGMDALSAMMGGAPGGSSSSSGQS